VNVVILRAKGRRGQLMILMNLSYLNLQGHSHSLLFFFLVLLITVLNSEISDT